MFASSHNLQSAARALRAKCDFLSITLFVLVLSLASMLSAQDNQSLAEGTVWPMGWQLPPPLGPETRNAKDTNADILVWTPPGATRIRSVLLVPNNTDSKDWSQSGGFREVAARHEMGVVYMRRYHTGVESEKAGELPDPTRMPALLKDVAAHTGIAEFEHAPWVTFGKSSRGKFPFRMGWVFPGRTIASIDYHGESPSWPIPSWGGGHDASILHVNANGETEWAGTWFLHVRPMLLNYHANTRWLGHVMVAKDVGHGDYGNEGGRASPLKLPRDRTWGYLNVFVDKALSLRMPPEGYPTDGPLALRPVDRNSGYLIDPFAVEELFRIPHLPLREGPDGFIAGDGGAPPVSGYLELAPPPADQLPADAPVVPLEPGKSPANWLLTDSLKFAMRADPMVDLGDLKGLNPKPGDGVDIDGNKLSFQPIQPKQVGPNGGIALNTGLKPPNRNITLLAYTILDVAEAQHVKVQAGFTAATRIQLVLAGVPVKHLQVVSLQPGKYPLLVVLRMSAHWERIEPNLGAVDETLVAQARQMQAELDAAEAERARLAAEQGGAPRPLIFRADKVPEEQRKRMFWVADREQAEAWFKIHAVHGQAFEPVE